MHVAMLDAICRPARSRHISLLAQPTKHERALLRLYARTHSARAPKQALPQPSLSTHLTSPQLNSSRIAQSNRPPASTVAPPPGVPSPALLPPPAAPPVAMPPPALAAQQVAPAQQMARARVGAVSGAGDGRARDLTKMQSMQSVAVAAFAEEAAKRAARRTSVPEHKQEPVAAAALWVAEVCAIDLAVDAPDLERSPSDLSRLHEWLRSGERLCDLINTIQPASVARVARASIKCAPARTMDSGSRSDPRCTPATTPALGCTPRPARSAPSRSDRSHDVWAWASRIDLSHAGNSVRYAGRSGKWRI